MTKLMKHPSWCLSGTIRFETNPVFDSFFSCVRFSSPCTFTDFLHATSSARMIFFPIPAWPSLLELSTTKCMRSVKDNRRLEFLFVKKKHTQSDASRESNARRRCWNWHSRLFAVTLSEGEMGGVSCWDPWLRCALRRSAILVEPLEAGTGRGLPNSMLLLEIAIAASSTAHRFGAVLVRSLVKVRSSPNAESRLFARYYMVARVNACYVACSIQDLRSRVILPAPKLDITSMPNFVGPFCCIKAYFLQVLL